LINLLDRVERKEKNLRFFVDAEFCFKQFVVITRTTCSNVLKLNFAHPHVTYEGWNFNSGNYLFTNDTK